MKRANCVIYNAANKGCRFSTIPLMRVSKNGVISFNPVVSRAINLIPGSGVLFIQSKEDPREWAIELSNSPNSFRLREAKASGHLMLNSSVVAKSLMDSLKQKGSFSIQVGTAPEDGLYELITSALK